MFQQFVHDSEYRTNPPRWSIVVLLAASMALLPVVQAIADPPGWEPMPEDVLRPRGGDYPAWYLIPYLGLNWSFLLSSPVRQLNDQSLGEVSNDVVDGGSGVGVEGGLDLLYRMSDRWGIRGGAGFVRRVTGSSGTATARCVVEVPGSGSIESEESIEMSWCLVADYVDIHLMGEFYIGDGFLTLGYGLGIPSRVTYEENDHILDTTNACYYLRSTEDETKTLSGRAEIPSDLTGMRHSLRVGGGYTWEITDRFGAQVRLEYDHPFTDVYKGEADGVLVNPDREASRSYSIPLSESNAVGTFSLTGGLRIRL